MQYLFNMNKRPHFGPLLQFSCTFSISIPLSLPPDPPSPTHTHTPKPEPPLPGFSVEGEGMLRWYFLWDLSLSLIQLRHKKLSRKPYCSEGAEYISCWGDNYFGSRKKQEAFIVLKVQNSAKRYCFSTMENRESFSTERGLERIERFTVDAELMVYSW